MSHISHFRGKSDIWRNAAAVEFASADTTKSANSDANEMDWITIYHLFSLLLLLLMEKYILFQINIHVDAVEYLLFALCHRINNNIRCDHRADVDFSICFVASYFSIWMQFNPAWEPNASCCCCYRILWTLALLKSVPGTKLKRFKWIHFVLFAFHSFVFKLWCLNNGHLFNSVLDGSERRHRQWTAQDEIEEEQIDARVRTSIGQHRPNRPTRNGTQSELFLLKFDDVSFCRSYTEWRAHRQIQSNATTDTIDGEHVEFHK